MSGATSLADSAAYYATRGLAVLPLNGKAPCGKLVPHGALDASTDLEVVTGWWAREPRANIGGRVPAGIIVLDVDPRHDGHHTLAALEARHGPLPLTLMQWSGRGDGGRHYWWLH